MLKYSLVENILTGRPQDYSARMHVSQSYNKTKFIKRLLDKGTLVTETDAVAALNAIENTIVEIIAEGGTLNLPLFNTSFSISGVFEGPDDKFDSSRHKLNVNLAKGRLLRATEKRVSLEKTKAVSPQPQIFKVKDTISGKTNELLTPNGVIEVRGYNIKITGDDPSCGLWFIGNHTEIKANILAENKPSTIIAIIPELSTGEYQLKLVTQYSGSNMLKTPKEYTYPSLLKVL